MRMILSLIWQQAKRQPWLTAMTMTLHLLLAALWVCEPLYSSYAIDQLLRLKTGDPVNVPLILGLWGALFIIISIVDGMEKYASWEVDNRLYIARREDVYAHALHLDIAYHTTRKAGETVKVLDEGAENLLDLQRSIFVDIGPSMLSAFAFLVLSFLIQPLLAGILVVSILCYIGVVILGVNKTAKYQREVNTIWVEAVGRAYDAMTNVYSVKANAQERHEMQRMENSGKVAHRRQQQVNRRWALIEAMNFFMLTRLLITSIGILLYIRNLLTLGSLYFFQASFFRVLTPFEILSGVLPQWNKKVGKVCMAQDILETPIRVRSPANPATLPAVKGTILLENVCFEYAPAKTAIASERDEHSPAPEQTQAKHETEEQQLPIAAHKTEDAPTPASMDEDHGTHEVLHDVALDIRAGEHIAFVGHSGAGKTTLAMLLMRFYDVTQGRITVDGMDLRSLDAQWWRNQIGLVLQENIMFNDTLEENIRYSRRSATTEEVRNAARRAAALDFIEQLPAGFRTLIGDRGIRLSGGQRQRIAIARAILKNPSIVILDEATSALDSVTEKRVQEGIKELIAGRTACIIAHRLSTVRQVNRIAVFDAGRLIACAPHEELLKTCAIYREMVELQSQGMLAEA